MQIYAICPFNKVAIIVNQAFKDNLSFSFLLRLY
jgi:hypothetical protein